MNANCISEAKHQVEATFPAFQTATTKEKKMLEEFLRNKFPWEFDQGPELKLNLLPMFQTMPYDFLCAIQENRTIFVHGPKGTGKSQMLSHLFCNREMKYLYVDRRSKLKNFDWLYHKGIFVDGLDFNEKAWPREEMKMLFDSGNSASFWISGANVEVPCDVSILAIATTYKSSL